MLCTINPDIGGHANDQKSRHYNVLASINAIATAEAGATPVNNPVNSSGTRNTNHNCITVISNTEAGGWLSSTSNHYTSASTFTSSAAAQWLDLYRESGKNTYPYYRIGIGTFDYPFNSSFTSYPGCRWVCGATTSNPASVVITSAEANYWQRPKDNQYTSGATAVSDYANATTPIHRLRFDDANRTYTVAVTANYIIIVTPDYLWYFGIRTVGGWEVNRSDNPPWVMMAYTRRDVNGITGNASSVQTGHTDWAAAWGATINSAGTQYAPAATTGIFGCKATNSTNACSLTGFNGWQAITTNPTTTFHNNRILRLPLFQGGLNSNWGQYNSSSSHYYYSDGVITDTVTGLSVPPVYPVVFCLNQMDNMSSAIGTAPGIYKGMHGTAAMTDYFVTGSSYTIGADTYVPVRTGNTTYKDLWFLRAA